MKPFVPEIKARTLYLFDEINEDISLKIIKEIDAINLFDKETRDQYSNSAFIYKADPIILKINSRGGIVTDGLAIVDSIMNSITPVHTVVTGHACSAATLVSVVGFKRYATPFARFMIHGISGGAYGGESLVESYLDEMKELRKYAIAILENNTSMTKASIRAAFESKADTFMGSNEAQKLGLIDEIIHPMDFGRKQK